MAVEMRMLLHGRKVTSKRLVLCKCHCNGMWRRPVEEYPIGPRQCPRSASGQPLTGSLALEPLQGNA